MKKYPKKVIRLQAGDVIQEVNLANVLVEYVISHITKQYAVCQQSYSNTIRMDNVFDDKFRFKKYPNINFIYKLVRDGKVIKVLDFRTTEQDGDETGNLLDIIHDVICDQEPG